jgi:hypothetical protein
MRVKQLMDRFQFPGAVVCRMVDDDAGDEARAERDDHARANRRRVDVARYRVRQEIERGDGNGDEDEHTKG